MELLAAYTSIPGRAIISDRTANGNEEKAGLRLAIRRGGSYWFICFFIEKPAGLLRPGKPQAWLELDADADLSLSVDRHIGLRVLIGDLTVGAVAGVIVRSVKLRAVEQVEVIELQNCLEAFP